MKKSYLIVMCFLVTGLLTSSQTNAQIKIEDLLNQGISTVLNRGDLIKIDKGFSPVFSLGNVQINKVGILGEKMKGVNILGEILGKKGTVGDIMGMYKTYRTGLVAFKVLSTAGTVLAVASTVKGISADENFSNKTVQKMLYPALASVATGVITKVLTKKASYKAVDVFNGVARKSIKDIFGVGPASSTLGVGVYVKL